MKTVSRRAHRNQYQVHAWQQLAHKATCCHTRHLRKKAGAKAYLQPRPTGVTSPRSKLPTSIASLSLLRSPSPSPMVAVKHIKSVQQWALRVLMSICLIFCRVVRSVTLSTRLTRMNCSLIRLLLMKRIK